jgi:hypothetical protein
MLTENDSGKYLNREWQRKRAQAMVDRTGFSDDELAWLEIDQYEGWDRLRKDNYEIETKPASLDPYAMPRIRRHDVRDRPECGGRD